VKRLSLLALLLLAACGDTYTPPPANPASANVAAVATLTAAANSIQATAAANSIQATAVSQQATATAASIQATQQAETEATATVLSALSIVAVYSTQTAVAIITDRQIVDSEATAVAILRNQNRQESADNFWLYVSIMILVGLAMALLLIGKVTTIAIWRWQTRPDLLEDESGRAIAHRSDYKPVRGRVTVPPAPTTQPQRNGSPVWLQTQNGATRANFAPMSREEATAVSSWLNAVSMSVVEFNRDGAAVYNIGHPRADGVIDLALSSGYATKDGGRSAPVVPAVNLVEFQDMLFPNQLQNS